MGNLFKNETNNMQKPHYKILVIGMSGAGKTTTINMLVNQAMSIEYRQERKIAITQILKLYSKGELVPNVLENNIKKFSLFQSDQLKQSSESQTIKCNIYEINKEDYDISFIDTPGFGDSGGKEADRRNQAEILKFVQQQLNISCILYVHRSTETRKSLDISSFNNPLKNILSDQIRNNFIVCFTNVINQNKITAIEVLKEQGIPLERQIFLENDCLIPFDLMPFTNKQEQQFYLSRAEIFWKKNKQQFDFLIAYLRKMPQFRQDQRQQAAMSQLSFKTQALMKMIHTYIIQSEYLCKYKQLLQESYQNKKEQRSAFFNNLKGKNNYGSPSVLVTEVQKCIQTKEPMVLNEPVMFCCICSKTCHEKCTEELILNGNVNIRKCKTFCEGKYEECTSCSHHFFYHSHTNEIQVDIIVPFGSNYKRKETLQNLTSIIDEDEQSLKKISGNLKFYLLNVVELEMRLDEDKSIRYFKSDFMQEYFQYSTTKAKDDKVLTKQQYEERINDLEYLNNLYQKYKSQFKDSLVGSQNMLSPEQKQQLTSKTQLKIMNLKQQYSSS